MTITGTTSRVTYAGTGSVGPFSYPFKVFDSADLEVLHVSTLDVETVLTETTHYTVTGEGETAGGTITLVTALASGETLTIRRNPDLTQETSIRNQGAYQPATIEDAFDKAVMRDQYLQDQIDLSFRLPASVDVTTVSNELPVPVANQALFWNVSALALESRTVDTVAIALPGENRTVASATAYLANNAVYNVRDYGAVGNGVADDTTEIQAAATAALLTNGSVYIPRGTYLVSYNILTDTGGATARIRFFGDGQGSVVRLADAAIYNPFYITTIAGVTFENFTIDGNMAGAPSALFGIRAETNDTMIRGMRFINCRSDGIFVTPATGPLVSRLTVVGCHFVDIGAAGGDGFGIAAERVTIASITGNVADNCTMGLCDIEPMDVGDVSADIAIVGNVARNNGNSFAGGAAIMCFGTNAGYQSITRVVIASNVLTLGSRNGIRVADMDDIVIANNIVAGFGEHGIYVSGSTAMVGGVITGNLVKDVGVTTANTYDGIHCDILRDGMIGNNLVLDTTVRHRYHIRLDSGCQRVAIGTNALPRAAATARLSIDAAATEITTTPKLFRGSATYDPGSLADGAGVTTTVTVTGAALGDTAVASFSLDTQGITVTAWVSSANTVSVRFQNESGGTLDLASGTLRAVVTQQIV